MERNLKSHASWVCDHPELHSDNAGAEIRLVTGPGQMRNGNLSYSQCKEFVARVELHLLMDKLKDPNPLSSDGGGRSEAVGPSTSASQEGTRSSLDPGDYADLLQVVPCPRMQVHRAHVYAAVVSTTKPRPRGDVQIVQCRGVTGD